jgi:4-amino-4-deoxy-L-arabinose transferase-like glycosyltransferase
MTELPRMGLKDWLLLLLVLAAAAGVRSWYLLACADAAGPVTPLAVQDAPPLAALPSKTEPVLYGYPNELDSLVHNLQEHRWFGTTAPLADREEKTAHVAPGYPWLLARLGRLFDDAGSTRQAVRWIQLALGALTTGLYFLFARWAFHNAVVATLAGLLCAAHPFWVINTAEMNDGVLATFLLACCLAVGTRGCQTGEALTGGLFGLALAGLVLVRAALMPFAVVAGLAFLLACRRLQRGWLCALVAFLAFANGLGPWMVRNFQTCEDVIPIVNSTHLHLWIGNNRLSTGGPQDEVTLRATLPPATLDELRKTPGQTQRYDRLAALWLEQVVNYPAETLRLRLLAAQAFLLGAAWTWDGSLCREEGLNYLPLELAVSYRAILQGTLLGMLVLGLLGWRWTYPWRRSSILATLALLWVPLPYVLGHAGQFSGPRLPLDGVLLCYSAFALISFLPGFGAGAAKKE